MKKVDSLLNEDAEGYYLELKEVLTKSGRFRAGDEKALSRLCHLYSLSDKLEEEMNRAWGSVLPKNNLPLYDKIIKNILSLESAFQLNPQSRTRAKIKDEKPGKKGGFDTDMKALKTA